MFPTARTGTSALLLLLLSISFATVCLAGSRVPKHVCHFDEINQDNNNIAYTGAATAKGTTSDTTTPSETSNLAAPTPRTAFTASAKEESWQPLRIAFSSLDMRKKNKFCDRVGSKRTDAFGVEVVCGASDVLTNQKKGELFQIVRSGIAMHTARLNVTRVQSNFVVPPFESAFCNLFTVPAAHRTAGVADADMILYVSSFPSSRAEMFAAGAPCLLLQSDSRPVAGALTYVTQHITPTVYSARVAAHEIAHTLGFTYHMMKNVFKMPIVEKNDVRKKEKVTELQSVDLVAKLQKQYNCDSSTGMELEDEAGILNVTSHSHWERRNALQDLMAGIVTAGKYSALTMAALQDMGVYMANYDTEEWMLWGYKIGCTFFEKRCAGDNKDFSGTFCTHHSIRNILHCGPDSRAMARCSPLVVEANLPEKYNYFTEADDTEKGKTGEIRLLTDRCPIYEEHDDLSCTDTKSKSVAPGVVDPQSWCLPKTWLMSDFTNYPDRGICGKVTFDEKNKRRVNVGVVFGVNTETMECKTTSSGNIKLITVEQDTKKVVFRCPMRYDLRIAGIYHNTFFGESKLDEREITPGTLTLTELPTAAIAKTPLPKSQTEVQRPEPISKATDKAVAIQNGVVLFLLIMTLLHVF